MQYSVQLYEGIRVYVIIENHQYTSFILVDPQTCIPLSPWRFKNIGTYPYNVLFTYMNGQRLVSHQKPSKDNLSHQQVEGIYLTRLVDDIEHLLYSVSYQNWDLNDTIGSLKYNNLLGSPSTHVESYDQTPRNSWKTLTCTHYSLVKNLINQ